MYASIGGVGTRWASALGHRQEEQERMSMSSAGTRVRSAVGSRLVRAALLVGCVVPVLLSGGVATASAATNPCTSAPTPVARVPTNPFGANVTIFDPSMSVASINAALNATPPPSGG